MLQPNPYKLNTAFLVTATLAAVLSTAPRAQTFTEPTKFAADRVLSGNGIAAMQFDPDGRLLLAEKQGRVLIAVPDGRGGFNAPVEFADYRTRISYTGESGLLGLALDPDYRNTRHIFLFHTTTTDQRLVRIRARTDFLGAEAGDPVDILAGLPRISPNHKAGDIHIRASEPDYVIIALGDDDQQTLTRNLDSYAGKILKVHKATGQGAPDNPFFTGDASAIRSRVWASGFRNPFRIVLHPTNPDILYASENGGPANTRSREDRISWVRKGADCAWSNIAYAAGANSAWFAPTDTKCKVLATDPPSTVGIALARSGPFAAGAGPNEAVLFVSNHGYPMSAYPGNGSFRRWKLSGADWDTAEPLAADGGNRFATGVHGVDLEFGPDGALYGSSTNGENALGGWYVVRRIRALGTPSALAPAAGGREGRHVRVTSSGRVRVASGREGLVLTWSDLQGRRIAIKP
jgi:glucose/arabinose dehydrogenase